MVHFVLFLPDALRRTRSRLVYEGEIMSRMASGQDGRIGIERLTGDTIDTVNGPTSSFTTRAGFGTRFLIMRTCI